MKKGNEYRVWIIDSDGSTKDKNLKYVSAENGLLEFVNERRKGLQELIPVVRILRIEGEKDEKDRGRD